MASSAQIEHLRSIASKGGVARAQALTPLRRSRIARQGFRASCKKYGSNGHFNRIARKAAEWRIAHPSCHEMTIAKLLDEMGVSYEREVSPFTTVFRPVDFIVEERVVVEVNGWGHELDDQHKRDVKKYAAIKRNKFTIVVIDHTEIDSAKAVIAAALEAN